MSRILEFPPGARFFKDEDGLPTMLVGREVFAVGPLGMLPVDEPFPMLETLGVKELDEVAFRDLLASRSV